MSRDDRFALLLGHSIAAAYVLERGNLVWVNARCADLFGRSIEQMRGHPLTDFVEDPDAVAAEILRDPARLSFRCRRQDGRLVHLEAHGSSAELDGKPVRPAIVLDVSDRVRKEDARRRAEAAHREVDRRFRELLENMDLLAVLHDPEGRIQFCNKALLRLCGFSGDELVGRDWFEVFVPAAEREARRRAFIEDTRSGHFRARAEREITTGSGERRKVQWNIQALHDGEGRLSACAAIGVDVTEARKATAKLLHDAFHDPLTGLANRALFMDRLRHCLALQNRRQEAAFSVLFLDVDRFKVINDSLGHGLGDELLVAVARRLQHCLRPGDTVARMGGDEFTILLEDIESPADAAKVADRIELELRAPFALDGKEVFSGVSIGIAHGSAQYERPEDVLRDADNALYRAKAQGRSRWVEFHPSMHDRAVALLLLETDLRRALDRGELRLQYQPVFALGEHRISGAEALVRWMHPERGMVSPGEFIPLAEETGLIVPIGAWVLREACRQTKEWQDALGQPLEIGVNLSTKQFVQPGLVRQIASVLSETGLSPRSLRLEVTESLLMERDQHIANTMTELRAMGVRIDLDDFGTGYSSLAYLHQFPVDTLKIDRAFVQRIGVSEEGTEIVNTILALAASLDLEVVAEGVETPEQLSFLREQRCPYAQGFHLARPLDPAQFAGLVGAREPARRAG